MSMVTCVRCGTEEPSYRPGWIFKSGDRICDQCHDEFMWWYFCKSLMLNDPEIEIPHNKLKETI